MFDNTENNVINSFDNETTSISYKYNDKENGVVNSIKENEDDYIEKYTDESASNDIPKIKHIYMKSVSLAGITKGTFEVEENNVVNIANLIFICKDTNDDLFILTKNYIINTKEENDMIEALPFYIDNKFENYKASINILINSLDLYSSEFDIEADKNFNQSDDIAKFTINAKDMSNNIDVKISMDSNRMCCIKFIDSYVFSGINNEHDLALASVLSLEDINEDIFIVDKIESIVSMAPTVDKQKKNIKSIGVVLKLFNFISVDKKEVAYLLVPFNIKTGYSIKKFKGKNITDMIDSYFVDSDQYMSRLIIDNIRISGINKEYMIVKACSKDNKYRIFLFDIAIREELIKMIDEY